MRLQLSVKMEGWEMDLPCHLKQKQTKKAYVKQQFSFFHCVESWLQHAESSLRHVYLWSRRLDSLPVALWLSTVGTVALQHVGS